MNILKHHIAVNMLWWLMVTTNFKHCFARWWTYSSILTQRKKPINRESCFTHNLNDEQHNTCLKEPRLLNYVSQGTIAGIKACQVLFENERWNCSSGIHNKKLYKKKTPESAYIQAISTIGAIYSLSYSCDRGKIKDCGCTKNLSKYKKIVLPDIDNGNIDNAVKDSSLNKGTNSKTENSLDKPDAKKQDVYIWSYCADHLRYALRTARVFLDPTRKETFNNRTYRSMSKLLVLQNNKAARKLVSGLSFQHRRCHCHGTSGQCVSKICYRWLPDIQVTAKKLYEKYETAIRVKLKKGRKLVSDDRGRRLHKTDLAYTESLSYCNKIEQLGIVGTKGRLCSGHDPKSGDDMSSCDIFCCGRGYNPTKLKRFSRCKCKFTWCCDVTCEMCEDVRTQYRCK